jgi:lipopolysaccharide transport system permease protein
VILVTSAVHVRFRDIGHALPLLLQMWMFASPVAYPLSSVPEWLRPYYLLNPMAGIVDGYRRVLLRGETPDLGVLAVGFVVVVIAILVAYTMFKRAERTFADVIYRHGTGRRPLRQRRQGLLAAPQPRQGR